MNNIKTLIFGAVAMTCLFSCEKPVFDDSEAGDKPTTTTTQEDEGKTTGNLIIRVNGNSVMPYEVTRAVEDLTTYCSRLNFVIYKDGAKVKGLSQMKGDSGYGQVAFDLAPGTYKLLVLAHSSYGGNPTVSDPENIHFTNALSYSDTFYYYGDIVATGESKTHDITLSRATTMVRFTIFDELPADLARVSFFYTGGSGVFNAVTGYGGDVDSRQEKLWDVTGYTAPFSMPCYTFLQQDTGTLNITVTALTATNDTIKQRVFEVPVKHHKMTIVEGNFFDHGNSFTIKGETDWEESEAITY